MTKRTDPHRPGAIVPANYEPVLAYNCATSMDGWPVPSYGINCELDGRTEIKGADGKTTFKNGEHRTNGACCTIGAHAKAHADGKTVYGSPGKCGSCGAWFVYGELWCHTPTGDLLHLGHDCADKYGLMMDRSAAELALGRAKAAVGKAIAKKMNDEEREAFLAGHPGLAEAFAVSHPIIDDIKGKFTVYRSISDKQVALVLKLADEVLNPKPPAPEDIKIPAPTGKVTFEGEVVGCKVHEGNYGATWKMTVKVTKPEGTWLAWGTVPEALAAAANPNGDLRAAMMGRRVEVTATLEAGRDAHFVFMKRPSAVFSDVVDHPVTAERGAILDKIASKKPRKPRAKKTCPGLDGGMHTKDDGSYWVNDARGIPLARVCDVCRASKLSKYRPEVLTDSNYYADEPIEPDYGPGEKRW